MVEPTGVKRKLAVILVGDAEGRTRLMSVASSSALKTSRAHREASVPL